MTTVALATIMDFNRLSLKCWTIYRYFKFFNYISFYRYFLLKIWTSMSIPKMKNLTFSCTNLFINNPITILIFPLREARYASTQYSLVMWATCELKITLHISVIIDSYSVFLKYLWIFPFLYSHFWIMIYLLGIIFFLVQNTVQCFRIQVWIICLVFIKKIGHFKNVITHKV